MIKSALLGIGLAAVVATAAAAQAYYPKLLSGVQLLLSWVPPDVQLPNLRLPLLFLLWITLLSPGSRVPAGPSVF